MLGWSITISRQVNGGDQPATAESIEGDLVANWSGGLGALDWLRELIPTGAVVNVGGYGYPTIMTARAEPILRVLRAGPPPGAGARALVHPETVEFPRDHWSRVFDPDVAAKCADDEWLKLEIWDQS